MCGIVGIYGELGSISDLKKRIRKMNESLYHRGPDAGREIIDNKIALGQRRLSIIETSSGANQPMYSNDNEWIIVFNGEIYNYKVLKKMLDKYDFKTESDTEVILASLSIFGIKWFLDNANGMFAIAAYSKKDDRLYLIRDRLGIKPLYYIKVDDFFIFSSEIKGILNSGLVESKFNEEAVDEYLGNRFIRAPYTFFKGIYQVEPGTYLEINKFGIQKNVYWDIPTSFNICNEYNEEEIEKKFEEKLKFAIKQRMEAEVPVGAYLSGGVDSSLITALMAMMKNEKIHTYIAGFKEFNEFEYANLVAKKYDCIHHETILTKDEYFSEWDKLICYKDAPLGVPNEILLSRLSEKIKDNVTVILSGEGADELLGGYGKIFRSYEDFKKNGETSFYEYFINKYEYVPRNVRDSFLTTNKNLRKLFDTQIENKYFLNATEESIFRFFHKYHIQGLLQRVDSCTMKNGIEARVPFLDHELIEYSYKSIPYSMKLHWKDKNAQKMSLQQTSQEYSEKLDTPKYILKKIAYKYLNKENIERKKVGFVVPLDLWYENLKKVADVELKNAYWLKNDKLSELYSELEKTERKGQLLWMFLNIEKFRKKYFDEKEWRY